MKPDDGTNDMDIIRVLKEEGSLIAKPNSSAGGGKGIFRITCSDGKFFINDRSVTEEELYAELMQCEDYILVQTVRSHEYSNRVYAGVANTMRVVTVMNQDRSEAEVLFAFHRFGTKKSEPVDNMSRGGLFALIDLETGKCGKAKQLHSIDRDYAVHPDTGTEIEGLQIPNWNELLTYLKNAHQAFPFYDFFAWDVVINQDGTPYILEINRGSDLSIQVLCPMRNGKLGDYMRTRGLLDER